jgi:hypothetical protein
MAKGNRQKDKQYNGQRKTTKGQTIPLAIILFVLLSFAFGHYIVCSLVVFLWPLYCYNIIAKGNRQKDKHYKGQRKSTKGQTI